MKRRDLEKRLREGGWEYVRHGGDHDIWRKGDRTEEVPRHREIKEGTARKILRRLGLM
jgi:mRNA interferase HicA